MSDKRKKLRFNDPRMLAPKRRKGYRLITVDGHTFNWQYHRGDLLVLIDSASRRRTFKLDLPVPEYEYYCCEWCCPMGTSLTPRDVVPYCREMLKELAE